MNKQSSRRKEYHRQKIDTYVPIQTVVRLRAICDKYGFNSIYQLLQYLVHCFVAVADPDNGSADETIAEEIEDMFTSNTEWEKRTHTSPHDGMKKKRKPDQRKIKSPNDL